MSNSQETPPRDLWVKSARDMHLECVYNDPLFLRDRKNILDPKKRYTVEDLLSDYGINRLELALLVSRQYKYLRGVPRTIREVNFDRKSDTIRATMDRTITKGEFEKIWNIVEEIKELEPKSKRKNKRKYEEPQLVYAIYHQKKKANQTWEQIFELYKNKKLERYKGNHSSFITSDELKTYYNRYRPKDEEQITRIINDT